MVGCSCIPPPASLQPRKIYNILVPDVFPLQPPAVSDPISAGTKRKIAKLEEYLQKSPGRAAKVCGRRFSKRTCTHGCPRPACDVAHGPSRTSGANPSSSFQLPCTRRT